MFKFRKKEKGAVIVEAAFVLPVFIFMVFTLMWVANMAIAQARIQIAVNSAAKEIASYTYLYNLTGLNNSRHNLAEKGGDATGTIDQGIDGLTSLMDSVKTTKSEITEYNYKKDDPMKLIGDVKSNYENGKASAEDIKAVYDHIKEDPKSFLLSLASATGTVAIDKVAGVVAGALAKALCEKHLQKDTLSANEYLSYLGVVNGYDGIDFSLSRFCTSGSDEIVIVAKYQLRPLQFFKLDVTYNMIAAGYTRGWFGQYNASDDNASSKDGDDKKSNNTDEKPGDK